MREIRRRTALTQKEQKVHQEVYPEAPTQQGSSLLRRGAQAQAARTQESERQYQDITRSNLPKRFWVPFKGGEQDRTRQYIILDSNVQDCPCFYEHAIQNPKTGRRDLFEMCLKETGQICPLCEKFGDSYFVQMITILELLDSPVVFQDGVEHWYFKRLLPVKFQQQEAFASLCNDTYGNNMRGARITTTRDSTQRSHAIGAARPYIEDGSIVVYTEEELVENFGNEPIEKDGRVVKEKDADLYPYDYDKIFPAPTAEELRMRYGGTIPTGSAQERQQTWGNGSSDKVTARDIKSHMKSQKSQDNSYLDDLDDEIPF
jgi:hypothetical protein